MSIATRFPPAVFNRFSLRAGVLSAKNKQLAAGLVGHALPSGDGFHDCAFLGKLGATSQKKLTETQACGHTGNLLHLGSRSSQEHAKNETRRSRNEQRAGSDDALWWKIVA
jgi:hypothetical protein